MSITAYMDLARQDSATVILPMEETPASTAPVNYGLTSGAFPSTRGTPVMGPASTLTKASRTTTSGSYTGAGVALSLGYTVMAWISTTSSDSSFTYAGNPANTVFGDWSGGVLRGFGVHGGKVRHTRFTNAWTYQDSALSVNDGKWHHIAAVAPTNSATTIRLLVDGVPDGTFSVASEFNGSGSFKSIGSGYSTGVETAAADFFDGSLAGLVIAPGTLTDARIKSYFMAGLRTSVQSGGYG